MMPPMHCTEPMNRGQVLTWYAALVVAAGTALWLWFQSYPFGAPPAGGYILP